MKTRSKTIHRLLSLAMSICMLLALLPSVPLTAQAAISGKLYLKPSDNWRKDGARFAAYFFGNGDTWVSMTDYDGDSIYECDIPSGYPNVIFCRMNGSDSTNNWNNKWNQTGDLTVPTNDNTLYTVPSEQWDGSSNASTNWSRPSCGYVGHEDSSQCRFCNAEQIDIYFENNWNWTDIKLYYWYADNRLVPSNPGMLMPYYGTANGKNYYRMKVPADITGFVISGVKEDGSGRDQTPDITSGWYDGITYYMYYDGGNQYRTFGFCEAFPEQHMTPVPVPGFAATCIKDGVTDGQQCPRCKVMVSGYEVIDAQGHEFDENDDCIHCDTSLITIFFQNNWKWQNINLYYWYEGVEPVMTWPGVPMVDYGDITNIFGDTNYHYTLKVPNDIDGLIVSGYDPNPEKPEEERNQQTPDISGADLYDGIAFYMDWDEASGNKVGSFDITEDLPCALRHSYEAVVTDPDCLNDGYTTYTCTLCGDTYTDDEIAAPGHTEEIISGYDATCTTSGLTDGVKCSICGTTLTEQEELPAPGHADKDGNGRCDACNCPMQPAALIKTSASLEGNIAVNYFMVLSDEVLNDETAYMQFVVAGSKPITVPVSEHWEIDGYYVFTCEVNAKEMTESIVSQFFYAGGSTPEHHYDVKTYGKHVLENPKYDNEVTKNLIAAMLNYGTASQMYFGHNTGNLANTDVTQAPDYSTVDINGFPAVRGQGTEKVKLYSASLILNSETTLRLFFNGNVTATLGGQELDVQYRSGLYYVDVVGIAAKDLDEDVTITIHDGTAEANITFNPMTYCQIVQKDTTGTFNDRMKDLACALYLYNQAANAYFE